MLARYKTRCWFCGCHAIRFIFTLLFTTELYPTPIAFSFVFAYFWWKKIARCTQMKNMEFVVFCVCLATFLFACLSQSFFACQQKKIVAVFYLTRRWSMLARRSIWNEEFSPKIEDWERIVVKYVRMVEALYFQVHWTDFIWPWSHCQGHIMMIYANCEMYISHFHLSSHPLLVSYSLTCKQNRFVCIS